jgi:two-component system, NarL family, nitrate/nitrite response regulator NarL
MREDRPRGAAIRVAAIDDHPFFLDGVRRALSRAIDLDLIAQGASAMDACRIATERQPDVMLLDIDIPGGGIEAARVIMTDCAPIKIIMLTASNHEEHVAAAIAAGAQGYLLKGTDAAELLNAIRQVHAGCFYVYPTDLARGAPSSRPN